MPDFLPAPPHAARADCELCREAGGVPVFQSAQWRVIRARDAAFPAFYRVVWRAHVPEWSDLALADQAALMGAVGAVERVLRASLAPTKINLASLGNVVPHLHWHVIARFDWDSHFPAPVWAAPARVVEPPPAARLAVPLDELDARVARAVAALAPAA
jgi:diadenosine tetraphosphate (Ap4A) HIT family hydrolase